MRLILISLVIAAACSRGEWVRDYYGHLPEGVTQITEPGGRQSVLVTDERTGLPIPHVQLTIYAEDVEPEAAPGRILQKAKGDEYGVVSAPWHDEYWHSHWVFEKKGYAPYEVYGATEDEVSLVPGRDFHGQLLDPQGRPVAGVVVESFLSCPHSPTVRRATTDAQGRFTLKDFDRYGMLWAEGLNPHLGEYERLPVPGYVRALIRAKPAVTVSGTLYDAQGNPVPDCPVRSIEYPRGPKTRSDPSGRFVLEGCKPDAALRFAAPAVRAAELMRTEPEPVPPEQPKERRLVRVHVPGNQGEYTVWFDYDEIFLPEHTDFFEVFTHHEGRLVLSFEHEEFGFGQIEVDVSGPETDVPREAFPVPGVLAVVEADGRPAERVAVDVWHDGEWLLNLSHPGGAWLFQPGARIRLRRSEYGYATTYRILEGQSPFVLRLGGCTLELEVNVTDWADCRVDGQGMRLEDDGRFVLRGLDAGTHTVLVGERGCVGKVARVVLEPGEPRVLELTLEPRPASASR